MKKLLFILIFPLMAFGNFTYNFSDVEERVPSNELTLLTFNVCALPGVMPRCFGGMSPAAERQDEILNFLLEQDADLLCLQEVWDPYFRRFLTAELSEEYPHIYFKIGPSWWGFDSGLFVASRIPLTNPNFIPYNVPGQEKVIHRGAFTFQIAGHKIAVTHLQPGDTSGKIRKKQAALIPQDCHLIVGDLNTRLDEQPEDFFPGHENLYQGPVTHEEKNKTLDYILTRACEAEIVPLDSGLSDHKALLAKVNFLKLK